MKFAKQLSSLLVIIASLAAAQTPDPAQLFGNEYEGSWIVEVSGTGTHSDERRIGTATVDGDGGEVTIALDGTDGPQRYSSYRIEPGTGAANQYIVSLSSGADPATSTDIEGPVVPFQVLPDSEELVFLGNQAQGLDAGPVELRLPITWHAAGKQIRINIGAASDDPNAATDRRTGTWTETGESAEDFVGVTVWSRPAPAIDDIIVVDNQMLQPYPFKPDGSDAPRAGSKARRLIVVGENLNDDETSEIPSFEETVRYSRIAVDDPLAVTGLHSVVSYTQTVLAGARSAEQPNNALIARLESRLEGLSRTSELLFVNAELSPGVTPGQKLLSVGGADSRWPLLFGDQQARLVFSRHADQARDDGIPVFYPGDVGSIDVIFDTDIPLDSVAVTLQHRSFWNDIDDESPQPITLLARRIETPGGDDPPAYRSDPIHFISPSLPHFVPPADPNALMLEVFKGDMLAATLADPTLAFAQPPMALAEILYDPGELGELWESALRRVAQCDNDSFDGDPNYALQHSTRVSRTVVGEITRYVFPATAAAAAMSGTAGPVRFDPSVNLHKGDHAAALLIRDEVVKALRGFDQQYLGLANNRNGETVAYRDQALGSGSFANDPLLNRFESRIFVTHLPGTSDERMRIVDPEQVGQSAPLTRIEQPLSDFFAQRQGLLEAIEVTERQLDDWLAEQVQAAAQQQIDHLQSAVGRADDAGDCALEELLVVAGQESGAVVRPIVARLVRKEVQPGPPQTEHWVPDVLARAFVERLHVAAEAVAALEEYADIDNAYKAMGVALATAGLAAGATAFGSGSTGALIAIGGDAADLAYFGYRDLQSYFAAEDYYEYAQGASLLFGNDMLLEAEAGRIHPALAAVGLAAPFISGGMGLNDLRYYRNIEKGRDLLNTHGASILDDIDVLPDEQKVQLAAYINEVLEKVGAEGVSSLRKSDQAILRELETQFEESGYSESLLADYLKTDEVDIRDLETALTLDAVDPMVGAMPSSGLNAGGTGITGPPVIVQGPPVTVGLDPSDSIVIRDPVSGEVFKLDPGVIDPATGTRGFIGEGSTTQAYQLADYPDTVVKLTTSQHGPAAGLDEIGYNLVREIADDDLGIPTIHSQYPISSSMDIPGKDLNNPKNFKDGVMTIVEKGPDDFKRSVDAIGQADGKMTAGQAIAFNRAMRKINDKGYVWLDNKHDNYGFVRKPGTEDEWKVIIVDPGGIVPMVNKNPDIAAKLQAALDNPGEEILAAYKIGPDGVPKSGRGRIDHQKELARLYDRHVDWAEIHQLTGGSYNTLAAKNKTETFPYSPINGVLYPKTGQLAAAADEATLEAVTKQLLTQQGQ